MIIANVDRHHLALGSRLWIYRLAEAFSGGGGGDHHHLGGCLWTSLAAAFYGGGGDAAPATGQEVRPHHCTLLEDYEMLSNTEQCESQEVEDHTTVVRYKSSEVHNALRNTLPKPTITCVVYTKRYEGRNTPYQILATLYEPNDKRMPTT